MPNTSRALAFTALLGLLVVSPLPLAAQGGPQPAAPAAAEAPAVTQGEALAAWQRFKAAPLTRLEDAPIFLGYMQRGGVHTVLNSNLLFFMYQDYPRDAQAVLYAAYMGGNLESQLVTHKQGDDPEAAMSALLDAYATLKAERPALAIKRLDELLVAREQGNFAAAVADLGQGKP